MELEYSKAWNTSSGVSFGAQAVKLHAQLHQIPAKQKKDFGFKRASCKNGASKSHNYLNVMCIFLRKMCFACHILRIICLVPAVFAQTDIQEIVFYLLMNQPHCRSEKMLKKHTNIFIKL